MLELQFQREERKHAWSFLLKDLVSLLPAGVWFDRISVNQDQDAAQGSGLTVRLTGMAFSQEELMAFLSHVEKAPLWESATLQRVEREQNVRRDLPDLYRFEITLGLAV